MERALRRVQAEGGASAPPELEFIKSGCTRLDLILGGGWPLGRISNIVGDKSVGKTLIVSEAAINIKRKFKDSTVYYRETEAAFLQEYADMIGLAVSDVDFGPEGLNTPWDNIEDVFDDLRDATQRHMGDTTPGLYIIDSLDALSSKEEQKRGIEEGSYNLDKQKKLGQLFRRLARDIKRAKLHLAIVSQVRDKIGVTFGRKTTRSGGRALDFYASQIVYLAHLGTIQKTVGGEKRPVAVRVKAKCDKNKVAPPFRECEFVIRFGYGMENLHSNLMWLKSIGALNELGEGKDVGQILKQADKLDRDDYRALEIASNKLVRRKWREIEVGFAPKRRKYD